jgi:hypothetical protein
MKNVLKEIKDGFEETESKIAVKNIKKELER